MTSNVVYILTFIAIVMFVGAYVWRHGSRARRARQALDHARTSGLEEPVSLHPKLDPNRCISVGACADACPEGDIIGLVNGRPVLLAPNKCIGHGACMAACPVDAITLVFGTDERGVDIPHVKPNFETNVAGVYIAGELGGMGLIRNAVTQGREAVEYIAASGKRKDRAVYDLAIVGAGPAGLAATLQAEKEGLRYLTVEQDDIGGAIRSYPRQKLVMTQPMEIPLHGKFTQREVYKEELVELWEEIISRVGIGINVREKLHDLVRVNGHFEMTTSKGTYATRQVLLSIGRRGSPRKLDVPGEATHRVTYRLLDPEQYRRQRTLVVGGGDSAVEAALALSEQRGTQVTLSYRKETFSRVKPANAERIAQAIDRGRVEALFRSTVKEITEKSVRLEAAGNTLEVPADYTFVLIGGELPTAFLQKIGIRVDKKFGER